MSANRKRQQGAALLILAVIVVLGGTYFILSRLNAEASVLARQRAHNAAVLNQAKQALIGHVAMRASQSGEDDPGALPCPEAPGYYNVPSTEGTAAGNCTLPAVGRLPWRTLGLDKLVDASGEPLWYAVSPGWAKPNSTTNTVINSNSIGQLTVDSAANDSVALIFAPGLPLPGQQRNAASAAAANYLDGENATADSAFSTAGAAGLFNDQVLRVTTRDVVPALEAAIAQRIEREIVPALKTVYAAATWGTAVNAANPVYPFPAPFADPGVAASYRGSAASCSGGICEGLFPGIFNNAPNSSSLCTPADGPLCDPLFVSWSSGTVQVRSIQVLGVLYVPGNILGTLNWTPPADNCTVSTTGSPPTSQLDCILHVPSVLGILTTDVEYEVNAVAGNVGMALRQFDPTAAAGLAGVTITTGPTVAMNSNGSATMTFGGTTQAAIGAATVGNALCGLAGFLVGVTLQCREVSISVPLHVAAASKSFFPDHPLIDPEHATFGWFIRNEWHRVLYYAATQTATPSALPAAPACTPGTSCITLNAENNKRAILLLAGRSLKGTSGDTRAFDDFLEPQTPVAAGEFATTAVGSRFNDRAIVVQSN